MFFSDFITIFVLLIFLYIIFFQKRGLAKGSGWVYAIEMEKLILSMTKMK